MKKKTQLVWILLCAITALVGGCAAEVGNMGAEEVPEVEAVAQALSTASFTATYTGRGALSTSCNTTQNIKGYEPTTSGTFPVFVFLTGTSMPFDGTVEENLITYMAAQSFVAATVQYDTSNLSIDVFDRPGQGELYLQHGLLDQRDLEVVQPRQGGLRR